MHDGVGKKALPLFVNGSEHNSVRDFGPSHWPLTTRH